MPIPKIEIKQDGIRTLVYMDGQQIHGIRGLYFERTVDNSLPILKLDIIASNMELDCMAIPSLRSILEPIYELKKEEKEYEVE